MTQADPKAEGSPRRALIVEAARRAFATASYDSVGLRDVAAAAGLDLGQVVREFHTKRELFASALRDALHSRPAAAADVWSGEVADELWGRPASGHTEVFGMIVCSGASPEVSELVRSCSGLLAGRIAANLSPGPDLKARASLGAAVITGALIIHRLLDGGGTSDAKARLARRILAQVFELLQEDPRPREDGDRRTARTTATRTAVLAAADAEFSRLGYDHATVRNIAGGAGVDPAQVIRSFKSKESLFVEVLKRHYRSIDQYTPKAMMLDSLLLKAISDMEDPGTLDLTLRSAPSPVARELLRRDIEDRFVRPLADRLGGSDAELRASLLMAVVLGIKFCRSVLALEPLASGGGKAAAYARAALEIVAAE